MPHAREYDWESVDVGEGRENADLRPHEEIKAEMSEKGFSYVGHSGEGHLIFRKLKASGKKK